MRLFADVASTVDDPFLRRALALAERARGRTAPNPLVGCVVVRDGDVVGEGFHPRAGEPHAEIFALAHAGEKARESDVYVTLEPCRHQGLTPPCTDALIAAGVGRVIIGMPDPTAQAGGGAQVLRAAGIETRFADDPAPFQLLNAGWLTRQMTGRPRVTVKLGLSLDAAVALVAGQRSDITGPSGAEITRSLRSQADAVMVGAATVVADDPALTVRQAPGSLAETQPMRIVLVRRQAPPADARVFTDGAAPTVVVCVGATSAAWLPSLSDNIIVEHLDASARLSDALTVLGRRGVNDLLVEPGPRLLEALLAEDLVDELVTVVSGGMAGHGALKAFPDLERDSDRALAHRFKPVEAGIVGDVCATTWRRS